MFIAEQRFDGVKRTEAELQPEEVWHIGDQYECDGKGSLNAGLQPVWYIGAIDPPYAEDKNILTAKTWSENRAVYGGIAYAENRKR